MTVKELKEFIAELPDEATVCVAYEGEEVLITSFATADYAEKSGDMTKVWGPNKDVCGMPEKQRWEVLSGPSVVLVG